MVHGVRYINDSTSTTPIAGQVGVEAFDAPIVLVAGGNTKNLPLEDMAAAIISRCRDVVLLDGTGTDELLPALQEAAAATRCGVPVRGVFDNFKQALDTAVLLRIQEMCCSFRLAIPALACFSTNLIAEISLWPMYAA